MGVSKTIFVTGATGNQGGAVVNSLNKTGFKIVALTRNPDTPRAQSLQRQNVQIVKGNLNDLSSYRHYLKEIDGIFSVQTFVNG